MTAAPNKSRIGLIVFTFLGALAIAFFLHWFFVPPIPIPGDAENVRFSQNHPLSWAIDKKMRFRLGREETLSWVEGLTDLTFEEISRRENQNRHSSFVRIDAQNARTEIRRSVNPSELPVWMDLEGVTEGFLIRNLGTYGGTIVYDSRRELVFYHFWD